LDKSKPSTHEDKSYRLLGFDTAGELFVHDEKILRGIYPEYETLYRNILETCEKNQFSTLGIVKTWEFNGTLSQDENFNLVLEHERIPFITYPHEWPATMLKDAALFHIGLFIQLEKYGLILKDWHPYNILFKNTDPVFIDFLSIIPIDALKNVDYLNPLHTPLFFGSIWDTHAKYLFEMYQRMYLPFILLPLELMVQKKYNQARKRMLQTTLNASTTTISPHEVFGFNIFKRVLFGERESIKKISLINRAHFSHKFFKFLIRELNHLDIKPASSDYVKYYELKNENFDFKPTAEWTNKQVVVYNTIQQLKPLTVLDVACNTGWFSILAAKNGCEVVAIDIDEASINWLYEYVKTEHLTILPLVIDITRSNEEIFPIVQNESIYQKRLTKSTPLIKSVENRLQCDMVLVLALIHHLALGQNMSFTQLFKILGILSKKYLILEFVPKNDDLIISDPDFFPAYKLDPNSFEWYTLENLVNELKKVFKTIEIVDSYPETRKLLICKK